MSFRNMSTRRTRICTERWPRGGAGVPRTGPGSGRAQTWLQEQEAAPLWEPEGGDNPTVDSPTEARAAAARPCRRVLLSPKRHRGMGTHTATAMNPAPLCSVTSHTQRATHCMIPFYEMSGTGDSTETQSRLVLARGQGRRK